MFEKIDQKNWLKSHNIFPKNFDTVTKYIGTFIYILSKKCNVELPVIALYSTTMGDKPEVDTEVHALSISYCNKTEVENAQPTSTSHEYNLVAAYLSNQLHAKVDITKENRHVNIKIIGLSLYGDASKITALSSMLPKFFPDIFTEEILKKSNAVQLLKEISRLKTTDEICGFIDSQLLQELKDSIKEQQASQLAQCFEYQRNQRLDQLSINIALNRSDAETYLNRYNACIEEYDRLLMEYNALLNGDASSNEDARLLYDILFNHPLVVCEDINDNQIQYRVRTTLKNYSMDKYLNKTTNVLPENMSILCNIPIKKRNQYWQLLNLIFVEHKYEITSESMFKLSILSGQGTAGTIQTMKINYGNLYAKDGYLGHPHSQMFTCTGTFASAWNEALQNGNLIAAINYTIAYTQNINFDDVTVVSTLVNYLYQGDHPCIIEVATGQKFTATQIFEREGIICTE